MNISASFEGTCSHGVYASIRCQRGATLKEKARKWEQHLGYERAKACGPDWHPLSHEQSLAAAISEFTDEQDLFSYIREIDTQPGDSFRDKALNYQQKLKGEGTGNARLAKAIVAVEDSHPRTVQVQRPSLHAVGSDPHSTNTGDGSAHQAKRPALLRAV